MIDNIHLEELESLVSSVYRSASVLQSVWNDKQYDFFVQTYVGDIERELHQGVSSLEKLIDALKYRSYELKDISEKY